MYDAVIMVYSKVYRGATSPFSPGWRIQEHGDAFANDAGLMEDFRAIVEYEKQWRKLTIVSVASALY